MRHALQIVGLLLFALPVRAQITVNTTIGTGTLYQCSGFETTAYAPWGTTAMSVGDYQGHIILGATEHVYHFGDNFYFGDKPIYLTSGNSGVAAPLLGVYVEHQSKDRRLTWAFFTGAIGPSYWLPYGYGVQPHNFGAGYSVERVFGNVHLTSLAAITGSQKNVLESVAYQTKRIHLIGTGGLLQNSPMINGNASYTARTYGFGVSEQTLILNSTRADVTSEFASYTFRMFDFHANNVNGRAGSIITAGQSAGVGLHLLDGALTMQTNYYASRNQPALILTTVMETVKRKYILNESVSNSGGHTTFNMGGGYTSNRFSASVGESVMYYPLMQNHPWVQTTSVTITVHVRDSSTTLSTLTTPTGGVRWTAYAGDYLYAQGAQSTRAHSIGKFSIDGLVTDEKGMGISGAALRLNGQEIYTDGEGNFSVHVSKKKEYDLILLPDENLLGRWLVKSSPKRAIPGTSVNVIEERE